MESRVFGDTWDYNQVEYYKKRISFYGSPNMIITLTKKGIALPSGQHVHIDYEFIIPVSGMQGIMIDSCEIPFTYNQIIPINSCQAHGVKKGLSACKFIDIMISAEYLNRIAYSVWGKNSVTFENVGFTVENDLRMLLRIFMEEYEHKQTGYEFILDSLSDQITIKLLRNTYGVNFTGNKPMVKQSKTNIDAALEFLREYYNAEFSLKDVARTVNLSPYHFARVFKAQTGKTTYEYLVDIKIRKAKEMLSGSHESITEISYLCGFNSLSHFTSLFKKLVGVSPSEYRKLIKSA